MHSQGDIVFPYLLPAITVNYVGTMLISKVCAATRGQGHGDIQVQPASDGHVWVCGPAIAGVCVDVHDLCYHRGP